jgi:hypothetical protein
VEIKYDKMSYDTGRVCIDLDSLEKTQAVVWVFGLPETDRIDIYAILTSDLRLHAKNAPRIRGGEFYGEIAVIEKSRFYGLPGVSKWKSINTKPLEKEAVSFSTQKASLD